MYLRNIFGVWVRIDFTFICKTEAGKLKYQENETREVKWMKKSELKELFQKHPEQFFTLHLGTLELYLSS